MPGKSTYVSIDNFTQKTTFKTGESECIWEGSSFRKGDTLESSRIKDILNICHKYHGFNINTLIVKKQNQLTIWIEEKNQNHKAEISKTEKQDLQTQELNQQSLPTKTVIKKYRGQVYEETVVDWSAVKQINLNNKPRRKYRGQYID